MVELHYQEIVRDSLTSAWGIFFKCHVVNCLHSLLNILKGSFCYLFLVTTNFLINVDRAPIGQGYGLTETCAGAAFSESDDISVGRVGPPLPCCYVKV